MLGTKLHAPHRRRRVVARRRLTDRLAPEQCPALTLVSAPAGFGKTTLLAEWFEGASAAAWLSLDVGDNDPSRFATYLLAALRSVVPIAGAEAVAQAGNPLQSVAMALVDDLEYAAIDVVLVVDDYHMIDNVEIHAAIAYIVDHAPVRFHLVVATRSDPLLPLARWRARGDLLELRAADLRFTLDEAAAYLRDRMNLQLTPTDLHTLATRTEGWIVALQLAALSMQGRDEVATFIDTFAGDDRFVLDYLAQEVLERQPAAVRRFLLETSVLERLNGPLCDAVTATSGAKASLEYLDRSNLFVVPLDDRRHWYRYHHLFADMLRARLIDEEPDLVPELHLRASEWYVANHDLSEAIGHALAGAHVERAAQLIELAAPAMRRSRQEGTLRRWLEDLPDEVFDDRPVLAISLAGARMATGDTSGVEALLEKVESALDGSTPKPVAFDREVLDRLPAQLAIQRAGLALLAGDIEATVAHARRALELTHPADHFRRASATALLGLAYWTAGDLDTAIHRYTEAIGDFSAAGHLADVLGCSLALADAQIAQGKLSDATRTFESGLRWADAHPGLRGAADMHVGLSEVLIERDRLDDAAAHLQTCMELGESAGLPQHAYRWRVTMARLCRARGDLDRALELIEEAAQRYDTDFSPRVRPIAAIRVRVLLARGRLDEARAWAAESGLGVDDAPSYVREYEHITLARVLIAQAAAGHGPSELDDAIGLLDRLRAAAAQGCRLGSVIEILILQAAGWLIRNDTAAAVAALDEALQRSEVEGHVRLFLHAGPDVTALVRSTAARADAPAHVRRVLAALDSVDNAPSPSSSPRSGARRVPADELSPRERDVLRLLRSDLSGPNIARELHVSLNTLRTHTKSIFIKLGATSRREAVRRATELGL